MTKITQYLYRLIKTIEIKFLHSFFLNYELFMYDLNRFPLALSRLVTKV